MIDLNIHYAQNVRLKSRFPSNNNSVTLEITREEGSDPVSFTIYGLPEAVTEKLEIFADSNTRHHTD